MVAVCCVACASDNGQSTSIYTYLYIGRQRTDMDMANAPASTICDRNKCKLKHTSSTDATMKIPFDGNSKRRERTGERTKRAKQWEIVQEWTAISFAASYICVCVLVLVLGEREQFLAVFTIYHNIITALYSFIIYYATQRMARRCVCTLKTLVQI